MTARSKKQQAMEGVRAERKRRVAALRLRGLSMREIVKALEQNGHINPDTQMAWGLHTIHKDCNELMDEWRTDARKDAETHLSKQLAEVQEYKRQCWTQPGMLDKLPKAWDREAKLLGLDKSPLMRHEIVAAVETTTTSETEQAMKMMSVDELKELQRACKIRDELLAKAATRDKTEDNGD